MTNAIHSELKQGRVLALARPKYAIDHDLIFLEKTGVIRKQSDGRHVVYVPIKQVQLGAESGNPIDKKIQKETKMFAQARYHCLTDESILQLVKESPGLSRADYGKRFYDAHKDELGDADKQRVYWALQNRLSKLTKPGRNGKMPQIRVEIIGSNKTYHIAHDTTG